MASVNFLYRSRKSNAELQLRLLYRYEGKDYVLSAKTRLSVSAEYWNKFHQLKRPKDIHIINLQHDINAELNKIESHILNSFHNASPLAVNKEWLIKTLDTYYNPNSIDTSIPIGLVDYIEYFIVSRETEVSKASIAKFRVIKHKLQRFEAFYSSVILIADVNENFKNRFVEFSMHENYSTNTIQRELVLIKTFCKHARLNGLEVSPQMDNLNIKKEKVKHIYLSFDELAEIEKVELKHDYLENARDWLIISCYTGQRVSDFMRFEKSMIRIENEKKLLEFTQKKTKKIMTIPLHKKVLEILDKNGGHFPRKISDQRYNDYIKLVCKEAKINESIKSRKLKNISEDKNEKVFRKVEDTYEKWKLVSSHIGRRSFASNFYGTIPTNYLIYVTGHSTETMFLQYIGKSNKDIAMELTNYFN